MVMLVLKLLTEVLQCSALMPLCESGITSCICWDITNVPSLSSENTEVRGRRLNVCLMRREYRIRGLFLTPGGGLMSPLEFCLKTPSFASVNSLACLCNE